MLTRNLQTTLVNYSVAQSGFSTRRNYIGLSGIADCEQVIYDRYRFGQQAGVDERLCTRLSYELEAALIERLKDLGLYWPGEEILLHGGLVQGHTDGQIDGREVLEIKTLPKAIWLPENGRVPRRVYWQVQAYMHYLQHAWAHVLYLARDTGELRAIGVRYNLALGKDIEAKVERLVSAVQEVKRPECSCGRCEEQGG
jgi:hypothetical protein